MDYHGEISVLHPGCRVDFANEGRGVTATVLSVLVESQLHVSYKVAWFDGRNRHEAWVEASELGDTATPPALTIGFVAPSAG